MPKVKVGRHEHHNYGWCMVLTLEGRIVSSAVEQKSHEGNGLTATALTRAVQKHPNVNTIVYDRCCAFYVSAQGLAAFQNVKYWSVDKMHAHRHSSRCPCNPDEVLRFETPPQGCERAGCRAVVRVVQGVCAAAERDAARAPQVSRILPQLRASHPPSAREAKNGGVCATLRCARAWSLTSSLWPARSLHGRGIVFFAVDFNSVAWNHTGCNP